ncbi:sulfatase family protein [Flavicella sediminum]|uniref:sulfatase family protein n=1 Tax=Flavicella sediminum TaxID=2585141 RepID=UPI00111CE4B6|nr:sulfatase [Flavicella sediminum]
MKYILLKYFKLYKFAVSICIFLVVLSCNKTPNAKQIVASKPNIIFILTDDQRSDALGYTGNNLAYTPEMDKLAKQGVFFKNAIATTPICSASRASIFTGLYERTHRYSFSSNSIKGAFMKNAFPKLLKESGYYTGMYGKFGVKYNGLDSLYHKYENYDLRYDRKDITSYYYKTLGKDTVHLTRYTGEKGITFIKEAPTDKPFCLQLSFSAPHASDNSKEQYFWQKENDHVLANATIPPARNSSDTYYDKLPQIVKNGFNRLRWFWRYDTAEKYQHSVKGYYRMIAGVDNEIGKIRKELVKKGIADNTIIVLMGDNGFFLGERQIAGKWLMYENSIKVPLVIFDPRNKEHKDIEDMALNIDIPSTILDYAGLEQPKTWHGKSLKKLIESKQVTSKLRDTVLIEHIWEFENIAASEGVRTDKWKYFRYVEDKTIEELYHLEKDQNELQNLAENPDYQDTLKKLRQKCNSLIEKYKDSTVLVPKNCSLKINENTVFDWFYSKEPNEQSAYQIVVSSSKEKCINGIGDVWDSKKIHSKSTQSVFYNRDAYVSNHDYFWKLRVWDEFNRPGIYSTPIKFNFKGE